MSRLLVVGAVWPEPRSSAAGARMLQLLRPFRERGDSIVYASTASPSEHAEDLSRLGFEVHEVRVNDARFDDLLKSVAPEIVVFDRFFVEEQFGWRVEEQCPAALRVLDGEDLHCLREARERAFHRGGGEHPEDLMNDVARREIASMLRSDLTLVISKVEMSILLETFRLDPELLQYCPFMVDAPSPAERAAWPSFEARRDFVSIGNFRHPPNADAVRWLKQEIWPRIRNDLPGARLHVAGAYARADQLALHDARAGFLVEGRIESVDALMQQSRVCLAPLRFGAGLKGKLIDAMRNGTPSVTTSIGAEGMREGADGDWSGRVRDRVEPFASAAIQLHDSKADWVRAQSTGFEILSGLFDRGSHERALVESIDAARRDLAGRRTRNFLGAMLRDHQHRSTRYLSLWIEAKNALAEKDR